MIELKLSQGAKPGKGGILPGEKVTQEIADIRGIKVGEDSISPNRHPEVNCAADLLDMINHVRDVTGLPVGFKSVIGAYGWIEDFCIATGQNVLRVLLEAAREGNEDVEIVSSRLTPVPRSLSLALRQAQGEGGGRNAPGLHHHVKSRAVSLKIRRNDARSSTPPWARTAASMRRAALYPCAAWEDGVLP